MSNEDIDFCFEAKILRLGQEDRNLNGKGILRVYFFFAAK
jgi:hypothetical protein